uniref:Histone H2A n=1 Tax=Schistocephalus solidus TaxID=70667 RepID=A0A0X3NLS3_SCHSO
MSSPDTSVDLSSNAAISTSQKLIRSSKQPKGLKSRPRRSKLTVSKSTRSGILFPVSRVLRFLRASKLMRVHRISVSAAVYLAAALEYMTSELLDLAGNVAKAANRKLLTPRFIMIAAKSDSEISKMLHQVTFPFSGVQLAVLPQLLPKTKSKAKRTMQNKPSQVSKASEKTLRKITLPTGCVLQVVQADMAELAVDGVVNPTSSNFYMGGMVGKC